MTAFQKCASFAGLAYLLDRLKAAGAVSAHIRNAREKPVESVWPSLYAFRGVEVPRKNAGYPKRANACSKLGLASSLMNLGAVIFSLTISQSCISDCVS